MRHRNRVLRFATAAETQIPHANLTIVVGIEDEDAEQLQRLAAARGQRPGEVISSLLRSA